MIIPHMLTVKPHNHQPAGLWETAHVSLWELDGTSQQTFHDFSNQNVDLQ